MSKLPSRNVNPHHTERTRRRHRLWAGLAVLFLGAVVIVGVAGLLAGPPPGARPSAVALSLPPSSEDETVTAGEPSPPARSVAPLAEEPTPAGASDNGPP